MEDNKVSQPPVEESSSEGFTSPNLSDSNSFLVGEAAVFRQQMQSGARWFYWIAGLSMINSIAAMSDSKWSFLAGLGITQFISGFALGLSEDFGAAVNVIAIILDVLVAGFFVLLGVFAQKGQTWAFIIGLVIYVLDGILFLAFQIWLPLAFHVFVVYCLYKGLNANLKLKKLEAEIAQTR
jgi:hypothetical protein